MLKSKIAMALAVAIVLTTLYGCSSGVSDSEHDRVKDQVTDLAETIDAIAVALGLAAGSSEADILARLDKATADQLAAIRTHLELAADADSDAILAAITALQAPVPSVVFVDQSGLPDDVTQMAGSADIAAGESATIGEVTYSCPAGGEDCAVSVNEDGAAVSTGGTATAAVSSAYTARITEETRIAGLTKSAETKEKAITAEAGQTADAGLGGTARTDVDGTTTSDDPTDDLYGFVISRDRDGTDIKITDPAMAGDDDPKFDLVMELGDGLFRYSREQEADDDGNVEEEVVMVRTDIEAPTATAFAKVAGQELTVMSNDGATPDTGETANALLIVADTTLDDSANSDLMFARSTTDGALNYTRDDPTGTVTVGVDEGLHDGTYNGADGTYRCTATTGECTVTFNAKGQVIGNSANWVFVPDKGATSDVDDADFLHYGFWLKKTDSDGAITYDEVETFAGSSIVASGSVSSVTGSAKYSGEAVGVYVHEAVKSDGTRESATSGHFSADVELMATFGQVTVDSVDTIADNLLNRVTGTIDNFDLSGDEANTWSVALGGNIATDDGDIEDGTGTAKGGVGDGSLSATFHGPVADDTKPHSVVGEFNAGFSNGSVAGAFGAREDKDKD